MHTQKKIMQFSGTVTYNGHDMTEFTPERTAAYVSQHDLHIGEMTVRETLAFSARCQGVGSCFGTVPSNESCDTCICFCSACLPCMIYTIH